MSQNGNSFIESLYLKNYDMLMKTAYRLTLDISTAENIVHETFVLAILNQKELLSYSRPDIWLMRSLHNLIRNELRSARQKNIPLDEAIETPSEAPPLPLAELLPDGLKPDDRNLLIWRFEKQLSYKELSEHLGISEAACRKRLSRALANCKKLLERN